MGDAKRRKALDPSWQQQPRSLPKDQASQNSNIFGRLMIAALDRSINEDPSLLEPGKLQDLLDRELDQIRQARQVSATLKVITPKEVYAFSSDKYPSLSTYQIDKAKEAYAKNGRGLFSWYQNHQGAGYGTYEDIEKVCSKNPWSLFLLPHVKEAMEIYDPAGQCITLNHEFLDRKIFILEVINFD